MRPESFDLSGHNARIFFDPTLPDWYAGQSLCPAETMILLRRRDAFLSRRVLDLGVGSGRTTRFLLPFASRYVGVDLSPVMLARARESFPAAEFRSLDIRELGVFEDASFDFVFAPWAVLDVLTHEERLRVLQDIKRITAPGGMFALSSHNRRSDVAGLAPRLQISPWPDRMLRQLAHYAVARMNFRRLSPLRREESDYALFNDMAHRWRGVFYYIDKQAQISQLQSAGFDVLEVVGEDGRTLTEGDHGVRDGSLHYVCRKSDALPS